MPSTTSFLTAQSLLPVPIETINTFLTQHSLMTSSNLVQCVLMIIFNPDRTDPISVQGGTLSLWTNRNVTFMVPQGEVLSIELLTKPVLTELNKDYPNCSLLHRELTIIIWDSTRTTQRASKHYSA